MLRRRRRLLPALLGPDHCRFQTDPACALAYGKASLAGFRVRKSRRVEIGGQTDKIVHEAVRMVVERLFEPRFADQALGWRPGSGRQVVFRQIKSRWQGIEWYLQLHLVHCVKSLDHSLLRKSLTARIRDRPLMDLIQTMCLYPGEDKGIRRNALTPLLCNIFLTFLDREVQRVMQANCTPRADRAGGDRNSIHMKYIRFMDQLVMGIQGPQALVRHLRDHITHFLATSMKLHNVHADYDNIALASPMLLGNTIKVTSPDDVRRHARDMEKRRRCIGVRMRERQAAEAKYESNVGLQFEQVWMSYATKALVVAEDVVNQMPRQRLACRITADERQGQGQGLSLAHHLERLDKMVQGFFTTRRPAAQDQYMMRKHLNCLPTKVATAGLSEE